MKFLKYFTTRNAFSREYGTWLIVLFNLVLAPLFLQEFPLNIIVFILSIVFFLMFRFEVLDIVSIELQYSKKTKIILASIYLIFSIASFSSLILNHFIEKKLAIIIAVIGICMLFLNIITRRKKGKRQNIFAQFILICFMAFLGALNYYLLTGLVDNNFVIIIVFNTLFFMNSIIYVRSKTMGSPYDIYALIFSFIAVLSVVFLYGLSMVRLPMLIVFIPTLVKTLDNVILINTKVPLRRIGMNETFHCLLYVILFCFCARYFSL